MSDELKIIAKVETSEFQKLKIALDQIDYGVRKGNITLAQATGQYNKLTHEMVELSTSGKLTEVQINSLDKALYQAGQRSLNGGVGILTKSVQAGTASINQMQHSMNQAIMPMMSLNYIIQDMPFGLRGMANNIQMLPQQMMMLVQSTGGWGNALTALKGTLSGPLGIFFGVSILTSALQMLPNLFSSNKKEVADLTEEIRKLNIELGITSSDQALAEVNRKLIETRNILNELYAGERGTSFWKNIGIGFNQMWKDAVKLNEQLEYVLFAAHIATAEAVNKQFGLGLFPSKTITDDAAITGNQKKMLDLLKEKKKITIEELDLASRAFKLDLLSEEKYREMLNTALKTAEVKKDEYTIRERLAALDKAINVKQKETLSSEIDIIKRWYEAGEMSRTQYIQNLQSSLGLAKTEKERLLINEKIRDVQKEAIDEEKKARKEREAEEDYQINLDILKSEGGNKYLQSGVGVNQKRKPMPPFKGLGSMWQLIPISKNEIDLLKDAKDALKDFDMPLDALRSGMGEMFAEMNNDLREWVQGWGLGKTMFGNFVTGFIEGIGRMISKFAEMAAISGLLSLIPGLGTFGSFMTAQGGGGIMELFKKASPAGSPSRSNMPSLNNYQGNFAQNKIVVVVGGTLRANRGEFYAEMRNQHVVERSRGGGW